MALEPPPSGLPPPGRRQPRSTKVGAGEPTLVGEKEARLRAKRARRFLLATCETGSSLAPSVLDTEDELAEKLAMIGQSRPAAVCKRRGLGKPEPAGCVLATRWVGRQTTFWLCCLHQEPGRDICLARLSRSVGVYFPLGWCACRVGGQLLRERGGAAGFGVGYFGVGRRGRGKQARP